MVVAKPIGKPNTRTSNIQEQAEIRPRWCTNGVRAQRLWQLFLSRAANLAKNESTPACGRQVRGTIERRGPLLPSGRRVWHSSSSLKSPSRRPLGESAWVDNRRGGAGCRLSRSRRGAADEQTRKGGAHRRLGCCLKGVGVSVAGSGSGWASPARFPVSAPTRCAGAGKGREQPRRPKQHRRVGKKAENRLPWRSAPIFLRSRLHAGVDPFLARFACGIRASLSRLCLASPGPADTVGPFVRRDFLEFAVYGGDEGTEVLVAEGVG